MTPSTSAPVISCGAIVLAGGRGSRMGCAKPWLPFAREFLLQRIVRIVGQAVGPVVVAARPDQPLPPLPPEVEVVHDRWENVGPLAGIAAGFDALQGQWEAAFVSTCDHPLLTPEFIRLLIAQLGDAPAVVPVHDHRIFPLLGVYRLTTRSVLSELLGDANGSRRAQDLANRCNARTIDSEKLRAADPELRSLRNVNDPRSYQQALSTWGC